MFGFVCKNSRFSRKIMKNVSLIYLVLHIGLLIGTRNQELRPLPNLFQCHESNGGIRISKRASVRNHVSRGKLNCLDLREFSITLYLGLCFGNRAYPWTHVDE